MTRFRLAAASLCGISAGILIWLSTTIDAEADRWLARALAALGWVGLSSGVWLAYSAYRRPSSLPALVATGLAFAFSALALLAWLSTTVGLVWCSSHPCGD